MRALVAGLLVVPLLIAPATSACQPLISDPRGDVALRPLPPGPEIPISGMAEIDLLDVELDTTRSHLGAVFHLAAAPGTGLTERTYQVSFQVGNRLFNLRAGLRPDETVGTVSTVVNSTDLRHVGPASVVVDARRRTVTIQAMRFLFVPYGGLGTTLRHVHAFSSNGVLFSDDAGATRDYRVGARACRR